MGGFDEEDKGYEINRPNLQTQQLERENKTLKVDSGNMNSVAKMVTQNMKETMETNKR